RSSDLAAVLLTEKRLVGRLPAYAGPIVRLDELDAAERDEPEAAPPGSGARSEHLAYVLYTSGSTGRPKGVMITHRSAVALLEWAREAFTASERENVLASTSICFDVSVFEIF